MTESRVARWSQYLIYAILTALPLERIPSLTLAGPVSATIRISQVIGLTLILINLPFLWKRRGILVRNPFIWLTAFWLVCVISSGLALDPKRALSVSVFTIFDGVLAFTIALRFDPKKILRYLSALAIGAAASCAFGFFQFFGDLLALPTWVTGLRSQYTQAVFGFPRIQSTALEPLYFGDYLLIPASILAVFYTNKTLSKLYSLLLLVIMTIIWMTVSRGASAALIIILTLTIISGIQQKHYKNVIRLAVGVVLSIGLAVGLIFVGSHSASKKTIATTNAVSNFSHQATNLSSGESAEGRGITRNLALDAWKSNKLLGVGPGNFGFFAHLHLPSRFGDNAGIVNNEPLEILAETGIIGVIFFALFAIFLARMVILSFRKAISDEWLWTLGLSLALIGIAIQYQTFSTLYITHIWVTIGLLLGVLYGEVSPSRVKTEV